MAGSGQSSENENGKERGIYNQVQLARGAAGSEFRRGRSQATACKDLCRLWPSRNPLAGKAVSQMAAAAHQVEILESIIQQVIKGVNVAAVLVLFRLAVPMA